MRAGAARAAQPRPHTGEATEATFAPLSVQYKETIGDMKARVAAKTGVPVDKQQVRPSGAQAHSTARDRCLPRLRRQLFWHSKEMVSELYDHLTLAQLDIHTGFGMNGYDLVRYAQNVHRRRVMS